jgi:hypothetical protein
MRISDATNLKKKKERTCRSVKNALRTEHYFGIILMVFLMAFAICLVVEVPLLNLEKLLVNPTRTSMSFDFTFSKFISFICFPFDNEKQKNLRQSILKMNQRGRTEKTQKLFEWTRDFPKRLKMLPKLNLRIIRGVIVNHPLVELCVLIERTYAMNDYNSSMSCNVDSCVTLL